METPVAPTRRTLLAGASALAAVSFAAKTQAADAAKTLDFSGKTVLITGTSSGFGRLTALMLARHKATVIASMRNLDGGKRAEAQSLAAIAAEENLDLHIVELDVLSLESIASGVAAAEEIAGGALDIVINNAGIGLAGPVELMDRDAQRLIFDTNLLGALDVARAALPAMRENGGGHIINVSSQLGRLVLPSLGAYCSTKFGMEAMFEAMAYELAPSGVEITIVQPGGYPTKIWDNGVRYTNAVLDRTSASLKTAYETHINITFGVMGGNPPTDPMDVPRAITEVIALPAGSKPLRRPVHPRAEGLKAANTGLAQYQAAVLSQGAFADWHAAVAG